MGVDHEPELRPGDGGVDVGRPVGIVAVEIDLEVVPDVGLAYGDHEPPGLAALGDPGRDQLVRRGGADEVRHRRAPRKRPSQGRAQGAARSLDARTGVRPGPRSTPKVWIVRMSPKSMSAMNWNAALGFSACRTAVGASGGMS